MGCPGPPVCPQSPTGPSPTWPRPEAACAKGSAKKKKDPNAPKGAMSAYMCFCKTERDNAKAENPDAKNTEITALLGARWRDLGEEEKEQWR